MKNFLLFVVSIALAVVFMPWLGQFYEFVLGHQVSGWLVGDNPEYAEGFIIGFIFFTTLLLQAFGTNMKKYVIIFSLILFITIAFLAGSGWLILISIVAIAIAFALAQVILLTSKKLKK